MPSEIKRFVFGTKAETLRKLSDIFTHAKFCPQEVVSKAAWLNDRAEFIGRITTAFNGCKLAIRSSAQGEDGESESMAGAFTSLLNIEPTSQAIAESIDEVFSSYRADNQDDEVLIQPMVRDVVISGVVLTRDLDTGSPYYIVNYDDATGRTDTVTGGHESKTVIVHRSRPDKLKSPRMRHLIDCVIEIELATGSHELDIEFCITSNDEVYILQVRPLAARNNWSAVPDADIDNAIDRIRDTIQILSEPEEGLAGEGTILSEMTDWNPAEMIGNAPRPLALSLYKLLITDRIWAEARAEMGYRTVDGPLLTDLHGRPYINVRKSFNSFLPQDLNHGYAHQLVSHQLKVLGEHRELHDKVEFEIVITCSDFSPKIMRQRLTEAGFKPAECNDIEASIQALTAKLLKSGSPNLEALISQANQLLIPRDDFAGMSPLEHVDELFKDTRKYGTLPFSQLARHGFIGVQLLRSLVERDVFSTHDMEHFMRGVHTIATDLIHDMHALSTETLDQDTFLTRYGHLRPGTYDISSWRYDERPDLYLGKAGHKVPETIVAFEPSAKQRRSIETLLKEAGFDMSPRALLHYIATAIQGREQSKFAFTRSISDALKVLSDWGHNLGLSRDDLSFLPISTLSENTRHEDLIEQISDAQQAYAVTRGIRLPHVIFDIADVDVIRIPLGQPTFITDKSVVAPVRYLTTNDMHEIDGHIVLIESADPGFDWIFSRRILGLITKYGGANSHMAIRSAEFGLPAAIGCGERLFDTLTKATTIELNAAARRVVSH